VQLAGLGGLRLSSSAITQSNLVARLFQDARKLSESKRENSIHARSVIEAEAQRLRR
jgi:hypothetical protein